MSLTLNPCSAELFASFFRHLKLELLTQFAASNDEKCISDLKKYIYFQNKIIWSTRLTERVPFQWFQWQFIWFETGFLKSSASFKYISNTCNFKTNHNSQNYRRFTRVCAFDIFQSIIQSVTRTQYGKMQSFELFVIYMTHHAKKT